MMIGRIISTRILTAWLSLVFVFGAVSASAEIEQARLDAISADLQARIDANRLSVAVVMVAKDGEIQLTAALVSPYAEDQVPLSTDSIFRLFSLTKTIHTTALIHLLDACRLHLP